MEDEIKCYDRLYGQLIVYVPHYAKRLGNLYYGHPNLWRKVDGPVTSVEVIATV